MRKPKPNCNVPRWLLGCWVAGLAVGAVLPLASVSLAAAQGETVASSLTTTATSEGVLQATACPSATECWAVGYSGPDGGPYLTLIEKWDGTSWSIASSPNPSGSSENLLFAVACVSTSDCWAAGYYANGSTLIENWDGATWSIVSSPNANDSNYLQAMTCASASECWAIGYAALGSSNQTLVEEWDGTSWSIVSTPDPSGSNLADVACASTSECWAVGTTGSGTSVQSLIERWDGTSWSIVSSPNIEGGKAFGAVTCASASECWAVGADNSTGTMETIFADWNGAAWDVVSSTASSVAGSLPGVICASASECWAVGFHDGGTFGTLVVKWDGAAWTIVSSPDSGSNGGILQAVACVSASDCWAVGWGVSTTSQGDQESLIEHWDGTSWMIRTEDNSPAVPYDTWQGFVDSTASGGTYRSSLTKGATATFSFIGTGITWVTRKGPFQGIATVTIDGKGKGNVDLYSATSQSFSRSYAGLSSKQHTIVIKVTGTKDASSGKTNVAVDAFIVGLTTTQETSPKVTYNSWAGGTSVSASGGTYRTSGKAKATAGLTFTGTRVTWVTATGPSEGKATITIDGSVVEHVDLYSPTVSWQVSETVTGLTAGNHTILITGLGTKDAAAAGTQVVVDAFLVYA